MTAVSENREKIRHPFRAHEKPNPHTECGRDIRWPSDSLWSWEW